MSKRIFGALRRQDAAPTPDVDSYPDGYRYPFTPYPRSWYYIVGAKRASQPDGWKGTVCGESLQVVRTPSGKLRANTASGLGVEVCVRNGLVFAHFGDGAPVLPSASLPALPELQDPGWMRPIHLRFLARTHVQEIAENALDMHHFNVVHEYPEAPSLERFELDGPCFTVHLRTSHRVLGMLERQKMTITYYGLGYVVASVISDRLELAVLLTNTPVDREHVEINQWISIRSQSPIKDLVYRLSSPYFVRREFGHDLPIWAAKKYQVRPLLRPSELNVARIRRWARQFYESSPTAAARATPKVDRIESR